MCIITNDHAWSKMVPSYALETKSLNPLTQRHVYPLYTLHSLHIVIENPKLVLIVGGIGLVCNLLGLVLFHDHAGHGHSHGAHSHSHSHSDNSHSEKTKRTAQTTTSPSTSPVSSSSSDDSADDSAERPPLRYESSLDRISPLRQTSILNLQQAASDVQRQMESEERYEQEEEEERNEKSEVDETVVDIGSSRSHTHDNNHGHDDHSHNHDHEHSHDNKKGTQPSGEDLNMRGVFLHVLGDALGSVGVIFSALFIWLTDFSWKQYMDPIIR